MRNALHVLHICLLSALLCLAPVFPALCTGGADASGEAQAAGRRDVNVRSAIVLDVKTGRVLFEQNADARIPPASLTKIMSMLVTLDKVSARRVSLKDKVRVSRKAAREGGSKMHIRQGEIVTLDRLLMGMAVSSGNDASVAVAEHVAGSTPAFVRLMNAQARKLGMKNTSFKNPNGLPAPGQFTSARDMGRLARYYLKMYPNALRYHRTRRITHNGRTTTNKNPLLGVCPGADGLKTGWINASGYNIISTVKRKGVRLLVVALGARTPAVRAAEVRRLVEAGFEARKRGVSVAAALRERRRKDACLLQPAADIKKRSGGRQEQRRDKKRTEEKKPARPAKPGKEQCPRREEHVDGAKERRQQQAPCPADQHCRADADNAAADGNKRDCRPLQKAETPCQLRPGAQYPRRCGYGQSGQSQG